MLLNLLVKCVQKALVLMPLCCYVPIAVAQNAPHPLICPNGVDGHCAPRRITYGYYETTWRQ